MSKGGRGVGKDGSRSEFGNRGSLFEASKEKLGEGTCFEEVKNRFRRSPENFGHDCAKMRAEKRLEALSNLKKPGALK
ncbi:hypothetical protein Nepgr_012412 [Nepenthes gracilis]|uniref:Uncharacterized protein n=1 Tax=Nepenthes gracilis TaxID=150966 RepID=A0AAD3SHH0_NEPGR|nr:hypothetical protein Nepgr_012412 [Nepenthes gracilis]